MDKYKIIKEKVDNIIKNNLKKSISYFGVNINNKAEIECKTYFNQTDDIVNNFNAENYNSVFKESYWLVEKVENNKLKDEERYELRLNLNTKKDCKKFLNNLEKIDTNLSINQTLVSKLCDMEINDLDAREVIPLYYLGIISSKEQVRALKFHFMTRRINKDNEERYDNLYYLKYISKLGSKEFMKLAEESYTIINNNCNLHLIGIDYFTQNYIKYKVYFKVNNFFADIYEKEFSVMNILDERSKNEMLILISKILNEYKDIFIDGFAICLNNKFDTSINLYFKFN